uniref:Uncharacterized protein n=1 Tax=Micrurus paraensis TaxID=1970185 RepID=A0A2D4KC23_9SAUR
MSRDIRGRDPLEGDPRRRGQRHRTGLEGATREEDMSGGHLPEVTVDPDRPRKHVPIGGRLRHFADTWEVSTTDTWVIDTVRFRLKLEWISPPPKLFQNMSHVQETGQEEIDADSY